MVSIQDLQYLLEPWEYWGLLVLHLFEFETADTVGVYIEAWVICIFTCIQP